MALGSHPWTLPQVFSWMLPASFHCSGSQTWVGGQVKALIARPTSRGASSVGLDGTWEDALPKAPGDVDTL